jgi:hypothetical protein
VKCPSCSSESGFHWANQGRCSRVVCNKCQAEGDIEEFGLVIHCQCEETLNKVEQGLGGVDEATELRAEMQHLNEQLKLQKVVTDMKLESCQYRLGVLRGQLGDLDWEQQCSAQAEEELAEARYWARKLYQDTNTVFQMSIDHPFKIPEWITWVDKEVVL